MIIRKLLWDEWNMEYIRKHGVSPREVEETLEEKIFISKGRNRTYSITGQTVGDRYLVIVLGIRGKGIFYPITAREADNKEKRRFKKI